MSTDTTRNGEAGGVSVAHHVRRLIPSCAGRLALMFPLRASRRAELWDSFWEKNPGAPPLARSRATASPAPRTIARVQRVRNLRDVHVRGRNNRLHVLREGSLPPIETVDELRDRGLGSIRLPVASDEEAAAQVNALWRPVPRRVCVSFGTGE